MSTPELQTIIVALSANPDVPKHATRDESVSIISQSLDEAFNRFKSWLLEKEPTSEVCRPRESPSINPLVTIRSSSEVVELLLNNSGPEEVAGAMWPQSWIVR